LAKNARSGVAQQPMTVEAFLVMRICARGDRVNRHRQNYLHLRLHLLSPSPRPRRTRGRGTWPARAAALPGLRPGVRDECGGLHDARGARQPTVLEGGTGSAPARVTSAGLQPGAGGERLGLGNTGNAFEAQPVAALGATALSPSGQRRRSATGTGGDRFDCGSTGNALRVACGGDPVRNGSAPSGQRRRSATGTRGDRFDFGSTGNALRTACGGKPVRNGSASSGQRRRCATGTGGDRFDFGKVSYVRRWPGPHSRAEHVTRGGRR
jgi:hypothetical protein